MQAQPSGHSDTFAQSTIAPAQQDVSLQTIAAQRFPRGLLQPEGSYRFGLDALLLASFAAAALGNRHNSVCPAGARALLAADLGAGCGVVAAGLALLVPRVHCLALEREKALAAAAAHNSQHLGLSARLQVLDGDLADPACLQAAGTGRFDAVLMNPPYRLAGAGRLAASALRQGALTGDDSTLPHFAQAAYALLKHHGSCYAVFAASGLPRLWAALGSAGLGLRGLMPVYSRAGQKAKLVLVHAAKGAQHDLSLNSPLVLYDETDSTTYSAQAKAFCPWL
jgi:tRNA1Val (adenine37-N6)-methyltransferase